MNNGWCADNCARVGVLARRWPPCINSLCVHACARTAKQSRSVIFLEMTKFRVTFASCSPFSFCFFFFFFFRPWPFVTRRQSTIWIPTSDSYRATGISKLSDKPYHPKLYRALNHRRWILCSRIAIPSRILCCIFRAIVRSWIKKVWKKIWWKLNFLNLILLF